MSPLSSMFLLGFGISPTLRNFCLCVFPFIIRLFVKFHTFIHRSLIIDYQHASLIK